MARLDTSNTVNWISAAQDVRYRSKDLSEKLDISPRQLRRYTRRLFGQSPQQWLNSERLARAGGLLAQYRSVKEVAFELGFKRLSHFCREFRAHYGVTATTFLAWNDRVSVHRLRALRSLDAAFK